MKKHKIQKAATDRCISLVLSPTSWMSTPGWGMAQRGGGRGRGQTRFRDGDCRALVGDCGAEVVGAGDAVGRPGLKGVGGATAGPAGGGGVAGAAAATALPARPGLESGLLLRLGPPAHPLEGPLGRPGGPPLPQKWQKNHGKS